MTSTLELTGTVQANLFSEIQSPADGAIEILKARESQWVEKGEIIATINPLDRLSLVSEYRLKIQHLEKQLGTTDQTTEDYNALVQELETQRKNLEYAGEMYQTIPVVCPIQGMVTERYLDEGSQVSARDRILTVSDMSSLVIKAEINEKYLEAIQQGKTLALILNAYPADTLTGVIERVYPSVDAATRNILFDIRIKNFRKKLLPGMMASVILPVVKKENTLSVPEQAIMVSSKDKKFLFIVDNNLTARRRVVETGIISGNQTEIVKGLNENEKVVVMGQEILQDGMKVTIQEPSKGISK